MFFQNFCSPAHSTASTSYDDHQNNSIDGSRYSCQTIPMQIPTPATALIPLPPSISIPVPPPPPPPPLPPTPSQILSVANIPCPLSPIITDSFDCSMEGILMPDQQQHLNSNQLITSQGQSQSQQLSPQSIGGGSTVSHTPVPQSPGQQQLLSTIIPAEQRSPIEQPLSPPSTILQQQSPPPLSQPPQIPSHMTETTPHQQQQQQHLQILNEAKEKLKQEKKEKHATKKLMKELAVCKTLLADMEVKFFFWETIF